jgi:hypothetical protein
MISHVLSDRATDLFPNRPLVKNSSSCCFSLFSLSHWLFCLSAMTSVRKPPAQRLRPTTSVRSTLLPKAVDDSAIDGAALMASTGMMQSDTHIAWAMNAPMNWGGDFLISSKRESLPSFEMRWKRYEPTTQSSVHLFNVQSKNSRRIAHSVTAPVRTTCLQFHTPTAAPPVNTPKILGNFTSPVTALALNAGR